MKRRLGRLSMLCFLAGMAGIPTVLGSDGLGVVGIETCQVQERWKDNPGELLIFIHSADLMCFNCLEGTLNFVGSLPPCTQQESVLGILMNRSSLKNPSPADSSRIQLKKLRGFIDAHHLHFRVVVDSGGVFFSAAPDGSSLVVIDRLRGMCKRYDFPLSQEEKQEVLSALGLLEKTSD